MKGKNEKSNLRFAKYFMYSHTKMGKTISFRKDRNKKGKENNPG